MTDGGGDGGRGREHEAGPRSWQTAGRVMLGQRACLEGAVPDEGGRGSATRAIAAVAGGQSLAGRDQRYLVLRYRNLWPLQGMASGLLRFAAACMPAVGTHTRRSDRPARREARRGGCGVCASSASNVPVSVPVPVSLPLPPSSFALAVQLAIVALHVHPRPGC